MFGLLNINKPAGMSSRAVVNRVSSLAQIKKVGHAGTLDPLATGVLVLGIGPATRLVEYVQRGEKCYLGTFELGLRSDTEDIQGEVERLPNPPQPTREEIEAVLPKFLGAIAQRPPDYSALKVKGKRAYALARQGVKVDLKPRIITIHSLEIIDYAYPHLQLDISCGSGTYIRSLGRDIAEALGTAAIMTNLHRSAVGDFHSDKACTIDALTKETMEPHLLNPALAIAGLPSIVVDEEEALMLRHGIAIAHEDDSPPRESAALDSAGRLLAILEPRGENRLGPVKNFLMYSP